MVYMTLTQRGKVIHFGTVLADRTNGRAIGTVLRLSLSVVCL